MAQPMQMPRGPRALAQADRIVNAACPDVGEELPEPRRTETLYAFTPPGSPYPPYLCIRRSAVEAWYFITVRAAIDSSGEYPMPGATATIPLDRAQLLKLFKALAGELEVPVSRRL